MTILLGLHSAVRALEPDPSTKMRTLLAATLATMTMRDVSAWWALDLLAPHCALSKGAISKVRTLAAKLGAAFRTGIEARDEESVCSAAITFASKVVFERDDRYSLRSIESLMHEIRLVAAAQGLNTTALNAEALAMKVLGSLERAARIDDMTSAASLSRLASAFNAACERTNELYAAKGTNEASAESRT